MTDEDDWEQTQEEVVGQIQAARGFRPDSFVGTMKDGIRSVVLGIYRPEELRRIDEHIDMLLVEQGPRLITW